MNGKKSSVWDAVSRWLPPSEDQNVEYWWKLTGPHVAHMMHAAGYPVEAQYDALLFHYHYIVPYLGPSPSGRNGPPAWNCLLGNEGSPLEYSWKWNTSAADSRPDVRYCIEAIGKYAGRPRDPLNQDASIELLYRLKDAVPTVDLTWTNHFLATLFDHDRGKYADEAARGDRFSSTIFVAPEWLDKGFSVKTYFLPRRLGTSVSAKGLTLAQWEESFAQIDPGNKAREALFEYLTNDPEGQQLTPFMLAVDNVEPSKSRLKLYFLGPRNSFASVRSIMTLGGKKPVDEAHLQELRSLICAVSGIDEAHPEDQDTPFTAAHYTDGTKDNFGQLPEVLHNYVYYFDIAPGRSLPDVKFYTPVRGYGPDDAALAEGLMGWMEKRGRGQYNAEYLGVLKQLNRHRQLHDGKGAHIFISCLITKDGELDITSYLGAEAVDPSKTAQARQRKTRRRSDSR
ncbi:aromatic prenyltransferase [Microdochium trichocladiopsis]|uniref:Aromatic prenyltransferase n=1 Tax=Microdochium trichocladiopsis TaxID=1682393 RepID=A0A9P8YFM2_9PEZI|nr:aromatic prenyltransferase [Microdochium trichocladiopsis]KAH7038344.1 aromatic prenyltransferase [Microdochium trichocladiopsis]